jgi:predicted TIM-barrel fold metal-dependent hydrolase
MMADLEFFDCNCSFGLPAKASPSPLTCPTIDDLASQLDRAGIGRAIVWNVTQHDVSAQRGNELLAQAIAPRPNLYGCWTVLPEQTGEMAVDRLLADMKQHRIVALRAFPVAHRFLLNRTTMGTLLEAMSERRIPLIYSIRRLPANHGPHLAWNDLHQLMAEFPKLTLIISEHGSWGSDRYFRPLLDHYERVYIDTTLFFLDGGLEDLVARYGPGRIIFGSGLPERYPGGMMLAIRHGEFDDAARAAMASANLANIVKEALI